MNHKTRFAIVTFAALMTGLGTLALAQQPARDKKAPTPTGKTAAPAAVDQAPQLPPGMTPEMMQACEEAGKPGPMHARLLKNVGTWQGKGKMWMDPTAEPMVNECKTVISSYMDGRFAKWEMTGDMAGQPMTGSGLYGFDNTSQQLQANWVMSCSTGMMHGTGEWSSDGKTLTWTYHTMCSMTRKPITMRDVETHTGKDSFKLESWTTDPTSGKEFKMMEIAFTRIPGTAAAAAPTSLR